MKTHPEATQEHALSGGKEQRIGQVEVGEEVRSAEIKDGWCLMVSPTFRSYAP